MHFATSQRNKRKLQFSGYAYTKHRTANDKIHWLCERHQKPKVHALFRHLCISGAMGSEHPNVYKLVDKLLDEQVRVKAICAKLAAGEDSPLYSRKEYEIKNRKLLSIIEAHDQMPADEYLEACGNYVVF
ncbi:hypothetical protein QR680_015606 [Steinernema hermaphroditum]|uniref:FLYWCH-type domain-containing protein n=1 Tax=Steinernema hermaphroditum TaxID=289476 RepID=A0AA39LL74_9BILA|nr:hypothetical protein QR680_015606 [Steinernema hermaphroditum]